MCALSTGEGVEAVLTSQIANLTSGRAYHIAAEQTFDEARIGTKDVDRLMIYNAFAQLSARGLEDLGFVAHREDGPYLCERRTASGGELPFNTNGRGLNYTHTGMYGMFALQESLGLSLVAKFQPKSTACGFPQRTGGKFLEAGRIIMLRN